MSGELLAWLSIYVREEEGGGGRDRVEMGTQSVVLLAGKGEASDGDLREAYKLCMLLRFWIGAEGVFEASSKLRQ